MIKAQNFTINGVSTEVRCKYARQFPPKPVYAVEERGSVEFQRATGAISEQEYQQCQSWSNVCGLTKMAEKCLTCRYALRYLGKDQVGQDMVEPLIPVPSTAPFLYRSTR